MSDEQPLNAPERELEAALGSLHPAPNAIDRDRMIFDAGRRSATLPRRPIAWQALSGALAAALLLSISLHRQPRQVERVVYLPATTTTTAPVDKTQTTLTAGGWDLAPPPSVESAPPATSYLILRRRALNETDPRDTHVEQGQIRSRHLTQTRSRPDLPADAGFFGRAGTTIQERL
jgi:hypothetical protein